MRISLSIEFSKVTSYYTFSSPSITNYRLWRYPILSMAFIHPQISPSTQIKKKKSAKSV